MTAKPKPEPTPADQALFTPDQVADINRAFAEYGDRLQAAGDSPEVAMQGSLWVDHASGGRTHFSLGVPRSADPEKLAPSMRAKYDRQIKGAADYKRQVEKQRRRAARLAWWKQLGRHPVKTVVALLSGTRHP